ncbi:hypothetical protein TRVL_09864 [Trypanosoma vivax]|nr:hypothetical protein TRVL_09864 [Trypanosoma vivax]
MRFHPVITTHRRRYASIHVARFPAYSPSVDTTNGPTHGKTLTGARDLCRANKGAETASSTFLLLGSSASAVFSSIYISLLASIYTAPPSLLCSKRSLISRSTAKLSIYIRFICFVSANFI